MTWRLAHALTDLRNEVNARWPSRDKTSDGTIGDAAHASRHSDHNPWVKDANGIGIVRAVDIDRDGIDAAWLAEHVRKLGAAGDPRLRNGGYVIYNRRITNPDWRSWRRYTGSNPHTMHVHVSFSTDHYDDRGGWGITSAAAPNPGAARPSPRGLSLVEWEPMELKAAERGTLTMPVPERDVSLMIQVGGAAGTSGSRLEIHRIAYMDGNGKKRGLDLTGDPVVPAGDPWQGNWLDARNNECAVLIEYSHTGAGAGDVHTATAGFRRAY